MVPQKKAERARERVPVRVKRENESCEIWVGGFDCHKSSNSFCCTIPPQRKGGDCSSSSHWDLFWNKKGFVFRGI